MTIKEFAEGRNISPQAVYLKMQKYGISAKQVVNQKTKELTPDGQAVLEKLYNGEFSNFILKAAQGAAAKQAPDVSNAKELEANIADLKAQVAGLRAQLDGKEALITQLRSEVEFLRPLAQAAQKKSLWARLMERKKISDGL